MNSFYHKKHRHSALFSSISSNHYKWLPSESWDKNHEQIYLEQRCKDYSPFLYLPPYPNKKAVKTPELLNRWVLCDMKEACFLWCECQALKSHFTQISLYMGHCDQVPSFLDEALILFISSQILSHQADLVQIIPDSMASYQQLKTIHHDLNPKEIWMPNTDFFLGGKKKPGIRKQLWAYSPGEWWADPIRSKEKERLGYIEKRLRRIEKLQSSPARQSPKGLAALLRILGRRKKKDQHRSADL